MTKIYVSTNQGLDSYNVADPQYCHLCGERCAFKFGRASYFSYNNETYILAVYSCSNCGKHAFVIYTFHNKEQLIGKERFYSEIDFDAALDQVKENFKIDQLS